MKLSKEVCKKCYSLHNCIWEKSDEEFWEGEKMVACPTEKLKVCSIDTGSVIIDKKKCKFAFEHSVMGQELDEIK